MAQPVPYNRQFNFQNQQALTPGDPLPADEVDAELNAVKLTLDQILANLELIQRDDGALLNESVARVTLNSDVDLGFGAPSVWAHNTNYKADFDTIFHESFFYKAATTHLSDPSPLGFANDLALGRWALIADFSAAAIMGLGTMSTQNADLVTITGGSIAGITATITGGSISGTTITAAEPDAATKVATKNYVDTQLAALSATLSGKLSAAAGTRMLFQQTAAPVGWTKIVTHNDVALRLVSGAVSSGGVIAFSTVFGRTAADFATLSIGNTPSHDHGSVTGTQSADHAHGYLASDDQDQDPGSGGAAGFNVNRGVHAANTDGVSANHYHGIAAQGGGGAHTHGLDIRVAYLDVTLSQKD